MQGFGYGILLIYDEEDTKNCRETQYFAFKLKPSNFILRCILKSYTKS